MEDSHWGSDMISSEFWQDYQGFYVENGMNGEELGQGGPAEGYVTK